MNIHTKCYMYTEVFFYSLGRVLVFRGLGDLLLNGHCHSCSISPEVLAFVDGLYILLYQVILSYGWSTILESVEFFISEIRSTLSMERPSIISSSFSSSLAISKA